MGMTTVVWAFIATFGCGDDTPAYDPLALPKTEQAAPEPLDLTVHDDARNRELPVRVWLPVSKTPAPVVLFSHGLGGSSKNNQYTAKHWSARGYAVACMQHPGSDESVWKDKKLAERIAAMKQAASARNFQDRVTDVPAVLDRLGQWNSEPTHPLQGRLDLKRVGMSGHSFGAVTTQAVSGQKFPLGLSYTDPRIKAAVAFSPSSPRVGDAGKAFGEVKIPWLLMTGTKDVALIGGETVESRLKVYPALPEGRKYELVLDGAEHLAFSDRLLPDDRGGRRNPNHHRAILALSTAFWDAYLNDSPSAKAWLDGAGPKSVLEMADRWQKK